MEGGLFGAMLQQASGTVTLGETTLSGAAATGSLASNTLVPVSVQGGDNLLSEADLLGTDPIVAATVQATELAPDVEIDMEAALREAIAQFKIQKQPSMTEEEENVTGTSPLQPQASQPAQETVLLSAVTLLTQQSEAAQAVDREKIPVPNPAIQANAEQLAEPLLEPLTEPLVELSAQSLITVSGDLSATTAIPLAGASTTPQLDSAIPEQEIPTLQQEDPLIGYIEQALAWTPVTTLTVPTPNADSAPSALPVDDVAGEGLRIALVTPSVPDVPEWEEGAGKIESPQTDAEWDNLLARLLSQAQRPEASADAGAEAEAPTPRLVFNAAAQPAPQPVVQPQWSSAVPAEPVTVDPLLELQPTVPGQTGLSTGQSAQAASTLTARPTLAEHRAPTPGEQVQVSIRQAVQSGLDRVTVQLEPAELGRVEVRIEVAQDGRNSIIFSADKPDTVELLRSDARQLERALQESGINAQAGDMQFTLNKRQQDMNEEQAGFAYGGEAEESAGEAEGVIDAVTGNYTITVSEGVDIRV